VGALPCYIATGTPFTRYHDDIDIRVNEEDIEKVIVALQDTDFDFQDRRYNNKNYYNPNTKRVEGGDLELFAKNRNNEFHLEFMPFIRGEEGEIILRNYFQTEENGKKVTMIWEKPFTLEETQLRYDETPVQYKGINFRMSSLENVYIIKNHIQNNPEREKDRYDIAMLEQSGMLDYGKVKKIQHYHCQTNSSLNIVMENAEVKR